MANPRPELVSVQEPDTRASIVRLDTLDPHSLGDDRS